MKVEIHDISNINRPVVYTATCVDDCNDSVDAFVFEAVLETNTVVTCGKIIGKPV